MGEMAVMSREGDLKIIWNKDNADEVASARAQFEELTKKKKFLAYAVVGKNADKGEVIKEFDPNAERIILSPPMAGG
jgi:hypothetical protein